MRGLATRLGRSITRFSARIPLRIKLITVALALVAIALAVISAVSVAVFRGYLLHQADRQLQGTSKDRPREYSASRGIPSRAGSFPFSAGQE